jgi:hypothetical protein
MSSLAPNTYKDSAVKSTQLYNTGRGGPVLKDVARPRCLTSSRDRCAVLHQTPIETRRWDALKRRPHRGDHLTSRA